MSDQYYTELPGSESHRSRFSVSCFDTEFSFWTDAGVFSKGELDKGTGMLLRALPELSGSVLDLGCGWGAVGIILKKKNAHLRVTFTDVNERALLLTRDNLALNSVEGTVIKSDGFEALEGQRFDAIITNPPIRAGKAVVYQLLAQARAHLTPNGALYAVIGNKQGADSAVRYLKTIFGSVTLLKRSGGFVAIQAEG